MTKSPGRAAARGRGRKPAGGGKWGLVVPPGAPPPAVAAPPPAVAATDVARAPPLAIQVPSMKKPNPAVMTQVMSAAMAMSISFGGGCESGSLVALRGDADAVVVGEFAADRTGDSQCGEAHRGEDQRAGGGRGRLVEPPQEVEGERERDRQVQRHVNQSQTVRGGAGRDREEVEETHHGGSQRAQQTDG